MKYFRVVYGFGPTDFYSVPEQDLRAAKIAQQTGQVFECDQGTVSGNNIQRIEPDYNRYLGFNPEYKLRGEDFAEIPSKVVREHRELLSDGNADNLRLS